MYGSLRGIGTIGPIVIGMLMVGIALNGIEALLGSVAYFNTDLPAVVGDYNIYGVAIWITVGFTFATYFVFGRWIWVASKNLWDHGGLHLEFSPASCIWWYAVPIANWFKPFQAMREIWNNSVGPVDSYSTETPTLLKLWWGCWVSAAILDNISVRMPQNPSIILGIIAALISIGSCWFAIQIVRGVTEAQKRGIGGVADIFA